MPGISVEASAYSLDCLGPTRELMSMILRKAAQREMAGVALAVFFFQAEDGIRAVAVTGVQTCALPISKPTGAWVTAIAAAVRNPSVRASALSVIARSRPAGRTGGPDRSRTRRRGTRARKRRPGSRHRDAATRCRRAPCARPPGYRAERRRRTPAPR